MALSKEQNDNNENYIYGEWIDFGNYWHFKIEQRLPDWFKVRINRVGGSSVASAVGDGYDNPDQTALYISGKMKKKFDDFGLINIQRGIDNEDNAIEKYEEQYGFKVKEMGTCIPKFDRRIGVSVDGVVYEKGSDEEYYESDGIIEVKCPIRIYRDLVDRMEYGDDYEDPNYEHIKPAHYAQMQLGMAVLNKNWADYIVYQIPKKTECGFLYVERIPFNKKYWSEYLYPGVCHFYKYCLFPLHFENNDFHISEILELFMIPENWENDSNIEEWVNFYIDE